MKTSPPKISAKKANVTKHADDLNQLDLDEGDSEGAWLAADDELKRGNQSLTLKT